MSNAKKFISAYNEIETKLKNKYHISNSTGFRKTINEIAHKNKIISMNLELLQSYAELRNAIVHTEREDFIIAEPHDEVVEKIQKLADLITRPPKVMPTFQSKVLSLEADRSIFEAIKLMFKNEYSQIPIKENGEFIGLLNSNTITRWFGAVEKEIDSEGSILIMNSDIKSVLKFTETDENVEFINRNTYIHEVLNVLEKNRKLEAIIITQNGKKNEKFLGIITVWDLVKINNLLNE